MICLMDRTFASNYCADVCVHCCFVWVCWCVHGCVVSVCLLVYECLGVCVCGFCLCVFVCACVCWWLCVPCVCVCGSVILLKRRNFTSLFWAWRCTQLPITLCNAGCVGWASCPRTQSHATIKITIATTKLQSSKVDRRSTAVTSKRRRRGVVKHRRIVSPGVRY